MTRTIDYTEYYRQQAGGGIDPYLSYRYLPSQKGAGFFGRLIKGTVWPLIQSLLPYARKKTLEGVGDFVTHAQSGDSLKDASKKALKKVGGEMFSDATRTMINKLQKGSGVRKGKRKGGGGRKRKSSAKRKSGKKQSACSKSTATKRKSATKGKSSKKKGTTGRSVAKRGLLF